MTDFYIENVSNIKIVPKNLITVAIIKSSAYVCHQHHCHQIQRIHFEQPFENPYRPYDMVLKMNRITRIISQSKVICTTYANFIWSFLSGQLSLFLTVTHMIIPVISLSMLIMKTNIHDCIMTFLNMTVKLKRGG